MSTVRGHVLDQHTIVASPTHGPNVFVVRNPRTGEDVERCNSLADALAAQAKWNASSAQILSSR